MTAGTRPIGAALVPTLLILAFTATPAEAVEAETHLPGAALGLAWSAPFAGMLLSIAALPLIAPHFWHRNYGSVALFWSIALAVPLAAWFGVGTAAAEVLHIMLLDYVPFIVLLFSLFTVAGGIMLAGNLHPSPLANTAILAAGTALASVIGTTGASMVLIRPLLRCNDGRRYRTHTVVFFIFLVSNIGGALTPLGDPPLFLGYLRGVSFFWTTQHLFGATALLAGLLLALFYMVDRYLFAREADLPTRPDPTPDGRLRLHGVRNVPILAVMIGAILLSGVWNPQVELSVLGTPMPLQSLVRDAVLLGCALLSLAITPAEVRQRNGFNWEPIVEVAKLFAGIFVTILPVLAILKAGHAGAAAPLVALVNDPAGNPIEAAYFWTTGLLSSFLDNAPTYLVFFNLAGGDAEDLMTTKQLTLQAISCGAVFMGAMTYLGNAPNFMVRAIADSRGVPMPSFFGYTLWSGLILLPAFALLTVVFFR